MTSPHRALFLIIVAPVLAFVSGARAAAANTFTNPIAIGADPWLVRHDGAYYCCQSENDLGVAICKSTSPASLGERRVVWRAPAKGPHSKQIWAPELHFLDGRWYVYVAASNGDNATHRMIVLESATNDPLGAYVFKAELYTGDNIADKT
ncbi:MAG: family 43 glycosylhydrolase, partial [Opitutaceae bacterium]|nr:family 43 glycosylhydrolase [Opitutaceae bacterium]